MIASLDGAVLTDCVQHCNQVNRSPRCWEPRAASRRELTDRIDSGDTAGALRLLGRLLDSGSNPIQLHAVLANHYERLWRVAASGLTSEKDAAAMLGVKGTTFPVKKAIGLARRIPLPRGGPDGRPGR